MKRIGGGRKLSNKFLSRKVLKIIVWEGVRKKNFTVDKHKHNLSQVIKFDINSHNGRS